MISALAKPAPDLAVLPTAREVAKARAEGIESIAPCLMPNCNERTFGDANRCKKHFKEWLVWLWRKTNE